MRTLMLLCALVVGLSAVNAQTRTAVKVNDLPKAITDNLTKEHQGWNAADAYKVDSKGVMTYEVLVKKADSEMNLVYDSNGKFLKSEPKMAKAPAKTTSSSTTKTTTKKKVKK